MSPINCFSQRIEFLNIKVYGDFMKTILFSYGLFSPNCFMSLIFSNIVLFIQHGATEISVFFFLFKSSTVILGVYPEDSISYHRDTCTSMFIAASVTIARNGTSPDVHQHAVGLWKCGAYTQWNVIWQWRKMKYAGKWMDLKSILLSKMAQTQKRQKPFSLICGSGPLQCTCIYANRYQCK